MARNRTRSRASAAPRAALPQELSKHLFISWAFDRVVYYLVQEYRPGTDLGAQLEAVQREIEKVRSAEGTPTLVPLHYALRACRARLERGQPSPDQRAELQRLLGDIEGYIQDDETRDKGRQLRDNLADLRALLSSAGAG